MAEPKKLSKKKQQEIHNLMTRLAKEVKERVDKEQSGHAMLSGTVDCGPCKVCTGGRVVKEESQRYFGDPAKAIIGPGYRSQLTTVSKMYCKDCGIMYHHCKPD